MIRQTAIGRFARVRLKDIENVDLYLRGMSADVYDEMLANLSSAQRGALEALAVEPAGHVDAAYRCGQHLGGLATVHLALNDLVIQRFVESSAKGHEIGDPVFADSIRTESLRAN